MRGGRAWALLLAVACAGTDDPDTGDSDPGDSDTDCEEKTWYTDLDKDGFGDDGATTSSCLTPPGTSDRGGDCRDDDPDVNPDALEVCGNGVDDNCDGRAPDCRPEGDSAVSAWASILVDSEAGEGFGTVVGWVPDVNGDGRAEVMVSRPTDDRNRPGNGWVGLYVGVSTWETATPWASYRRRMDNENLGIAAASGDLNGDGAVDLLLASPRTTLGGTEDVGAVHLVLGPLSPGERDLGLSPGVVWTGSNRRDSAGRAVLVLARARGAEGARAVIGTPELTGDQPGLVHLLDPGTAAGELVDVAAATVTGVAAEARFGEVVVDAGDTDGDGTAEILVGGITRVGATSTWRLFLDVPDGVSSAADADFTLDGTSRVTLQTGVAVGGDWNGDGYGDLALGAPAYADATADAGGIYVFEGPLSGPWDLATADGRVEGAGRSRLGARVAAGDIDGDGRTDLVATTDPVSGTTSLLLHYEPVVGVVERMHAALQVAPDVRRFGAGLAAGGDVDGDGVGDVLVGAPGFTADPGRLFVLGWDGL